VAVTTKHSPNYAALQCTFVYQLVMQPKHLPVNILLR